ncbi:MAG: apolipoprotein N-acyltransferase [bacterium]
MKKNRRPEQAGAFPPSEPLSLRAARVLAAPLSGLLLIPAFAPYNITVLAWAALLPLLWSLSGATIRGAALRGYLFGVAYLASLFWWLVVVRYPAPLGYAFFAIVLPVIFIPWAVLANRLMRLKSAVYRIWLPAALWTLFEFSMSHGALALPWWSLANTQAKNLVTAQIAAVGGVYSISFLIVLINFVLFAALTAFISGRNKKIIPAGKNAKYTKQREDKIPGPQSPFQNDFISDMTTYAAAAALLAASIIYGCVSLSQPIKITRPRPVRLALIQGSFDQNEKDANVEMGVLLKKHLEMTDAAVAKEHPDIIVWSETITPLSWLNDTPNRESWLTRLKYYNASLVTGVYNWDKRDRSFNSVVAFDPDKGLLGEYRKIQVVPFGEKFPFRAQIEKISPWAGRWIKREVYEYDTYPGKEYTVFDSKFGKFGAVICFESVFPQIVRPIVRRGAEFLFIITNDAWFYDTPGTYQHAAIASLRAIESRRFVVQAANSGISAIIDPYGRVVAETKIFVQDTLFGDIYPETEITLYTRFGDVIVWLCLAFAIPALAAFATGARKTPESNAPAPEPPIKKKAAKR